MVSVVIPAKDEEDAIGDTVFQVKTHLSNIEHEVIVVNDGSSDCTGKRAADAGARVITHLHNLGYGAALKSGINDSRYDTIIIVDADGTYPIDYLPKLLAVYLEGYDMVVGERTGKYFFESTVKAPLRMILRFLVEYTTGRKVPDVNSGFRVFSKKEIIPYFSNLCSTFSFTTSVTLAYMMTNKFVIYVPIPYRKRMGKTKVHIFRDSLRTLQTIIQGILFYNPIKLFLLMSIITLVVSVLYFFISKLITQNYFLSFYPALGGFLMSIHIFCLGLIAEMLRQIKERK